MDLMKNHDALIGLTYNQNIILNALKSGYDMMRSELVDMLDLSRSTIFDALKVLYRKGLVGKYVRNLPGRGRPHTYWYARCLGLCIDCVAFSPKHGCKCYEPEKERVV